MLSVNRELHLQRLRELIDKSTRQGLADAFGCDNSTITKHYSGDRGVTTEMLVKYCRHFGVSADWLLGLSSDPVRRKSGYWIETFRQDSLSGDETYVEEKCVWCERQTSRYDTQPQDKYCPHCGAKMDLKEDKQ